MSINPAYDRKKNCKVAAKFLPNGWDSYKKTPMTIGHRSEKGDAYLMVRASRSACLPAYRPMGSTCTREMVTMWVPFSALKFS